MIANEHFILASASRIRRTLLTNAGLNFEICPHPINEDAIKTTLLNENKQQSLSDIARILAEKKAIPISKARPEEKVIGADQIMVFKNRLLSKPDSIEEARTRLIKMRGQTHELISAVVIAESGSVLWSCEDTVRLTMRAFSDEFLDAYLAQTRDDILETVGGYRFEGLGIHLFEKIEGDYFSLLGMPMLPLLNFLHRDKTGSGAI